MNLSLGDELPRVRADAEQLRQVFLNLALNAVQAMPSGGKLTISTSLRKGGRRGPSAYLEVRFRDSGAGIPPAVLKNLFIPFYTTKEKGTGLGLPHQPAIIENHGGTHRGAQQGRGGLDLHGGVAGLRREREREREAGVDRQGQLTRRRDPDSCARASAQALAWVSP